MAPVISQLVVYPVKGCAGTAVDEVPLRVTGLAHDRELMLVDADGGGFLSQRRFPAMAALRPQLSADGGKLTVSAPRGSDLVHEVAVDGPRIPVAVHSWQGEAVDQGDEAADWFTEALGTAVRLVRVPPGLDRSRDGRYPSRTGFADAYPILLTSTSSLDLLNDRILATGAEPVPMERFRPNIVVGGWAEPHTEDLLDRLGIGGAELGFTKKCKRCTVPLVDQETGAKAGPEPIRSLAGYRRDPEDGGVTFGANYAVLVPGQLAVGDAVIVHSWAE